MDLIIVTAGNVPV